MGKMITIVGPTASGKSALAMRLAEKYHGQIICADSRTIYRGMDIGTAKPSTADRKRVRHYLLDIVNPNQDFSVAKFKQQALEAIHRVEKDGYLPFLVGGSGMYVDAILFDYQFRNQSSTDKDLAGLADEDLLALAKSQYPGVDMASIAKNRRRLEQLVGRGPANTDDRQEQRVDSLVLGLSKEKLELKQEIECRTSDILNNAFVQEVEQLLSKYGPSLPALQSTGYKPVLGYVQGDMDKEEMRLAIIADTLKLAKKQLTWFRRNPNIHWITSGTEADRLVRAYLSA